MQHHWYPEGYIDPWTAPKTPVWTNPFKSYHDPHLAATNASNPAVTSGSTGQLLSSGTQKGQTPAFSHRKAPSVASTMVPVSPAPGRLPRVDSIRGSSTVRSSWSSKNGELAIVDTPPWDGASEFINGSTYFKVDTIYINTSPDYLLGLNSQILS